VEEYPHKAGDSHRWSFAVSPLLTVTGTHKYGKRGMWSIGSRGGTHVAAVQAKSPSENLRPVPPRHARDCASEMKPSADGNQRRWALIDPARTRSQLTEFIRVI